MSSTDRMQPPWAGSAAGSEGGQCLQWTLCDRTRYVMSRRNPWANQRADLDEVHFYHFVKIGMLCMHISQNSDFLTAVDLALLRGVIFLP